MEGKRATLMATDPPYLVDYQGGQHPASEANGGAETKDKHWDAYIDHEHSVEFYVDFLRTALELALTPDAAVYQWFGIMRTEVVWQRWSEVGLLPHQVLIWKKTTSVLTYSHFMWDYEPMMYGWPEGHMPKAKPPADAKAVWEIELGDRGRRRPASIRRRSRSRPCGGRSPTTRSPVASSTSPSPVPARRSSPPRRRAGAATPSSRRPQFCDVAVAVGALHR